MNLSNLARPYGGVAYREESGDRGDEGAGAAGGEDEAAVAAASAAKAAEDAKAAEAVKAAEKARVEAEVSIPKKRFDEAVGKERAAREAAEKRATELEAAEAARKAVLDVKKVEKEISDLEDELEKANAEGTPEKRKELRAAIRTKERQLISAESRQDAAQARDHAVEQIRYDTVVDRVEVDYPFLDTANEDFSQPLANEVMELKAGFEGTGLSSSAALKKAIKYLKPQLDAAKKADKEGDEAAKAKAEAAAKAKAAEEAAAAGGDAAARAAVEKRRAAAVAAGAAAAAAQAAKGSGTGSGDKTVKTVDPTKMSDEAFSKLTKEEKAKMRGD